MNTFEFDGVSCTTYGAYVHSMYPANVAMKSEEVVQIPGKNGALVLPNGNFQNVEVEYQVFFNRNFSTNFKALVARILSVDGYCVLRDSRDTTYFRMARLVEWESDVVAQDLSAGAARLLFDCMPQRFLVSGETVKTFTAAGTITNPTLYASRPLIRVYGTGTVGVGSMTITIATNPYNYIDIDSDKQVCFNGGSNAGQYVTMSSLAYPTLAAGNTGITKTSGITRIEITPRWWTV